MKSSLMFARSPLMLVGATAAGLLAAGLLSASALAQPMGGSGAMGYPPMHDGPMHDGPMHGDPMHGPMMGGALPTPEYVRKAAQSDEFEIGAARMALHRSQNPRVQQFAQRMLTDHNRSTMMIQAAVRRSMHMTPPPPPLSPEQVQMMGALRSAGPGPMFDRMYVDQQVQAHQMALTVHQGYASGGMDPALRRTAGMIVPVVQMHLDMARRMQTHMD